MYWVFYAKWGIKYLFDELKFITYLNFNVLKFFSRYDRGGMVQTAEQYEFVHRALCLYEQTLEGGKSSSSGDWNYKQSDYGNW